MDELNLMSEQIRRANPDDEEKLTEIAHAAKRHWGYPETWIGLWEDTLTITADFISNNEVYIARSDGKAVGFYALIIHDEKATLEHMWVLPDRIGTGLGKELFRHAATTAQRLGAKRIEIESDPYAEGFYKRMGAKRVGEVTTEIEGKPRQLPLLVYDVESSL
jgi:GNAT superfamily N-acetyltransferase